MKYPLPTEPIPQSARRQINEKLLYLIDNDACAAYDVSKADVFQAYTGRGGLHGLRRSDYNSRFSARDMQPPPRINKNLIMIIQCSALFDKRRRRPYNTHQKK